MAKRVESSSEPDVDLSLESGYHTRGMPPESVEANTESMMIPHQKEVPREVQSPSCDLEPSLQAGMFIMMVSRQDACFLNNWCLEQKCHS